MKTLLKPFRWIAGILLVVGGLFGFLPILGFWMIPCGLLLLAPDFPWAARLLEKTKAWFKDSRRNSPPDAP